MTFTAKGEARRTALLDAVLRVLEREGPGAVTHRSVAHEAGVAVSAATYYFETIDDLYVSALRRATAHQIAQFESVGETDLHGLAEVLHSMVYSSEGAMVAQYELMFLARHRKALTADAARWYEALEHAIDPERRHPRRTRVRALAIDGLLLRMLWLGSPDTVDGVADALKDVTSTTSA